MSELEVLEMVGRKIRLVTTDNKVYEGFMNNLEGSNDSENGQYCIDISVKGGLGEYGIYENEIESIEVIE